jgi:hypothetical protein
MSRTWPAIRPTPVWPAACAMVSPASAHTTTCNAVTRKGARPYKGVTDAASSNVKTSDFTPRMLLILLILRGIP